MGSEEAVSSRISPQGRGPAAYGYPLASGRATRTRKEASLRNQPWGTPTVCEGRSSPDQSGSPALPARRCVRTASPIHSVTWGCAPPTSPRTCALRRPLWCHVPGASHRLLGGCFLWLSPPPPPPPLGGRGKLGGSGLEKARFWFGSAARYATCPLPGVWNVGAAGEMEAAWVGPD